MQAKTPGKAPFLALAACAAALGLTLALAGTAKTPAGDAKAPVTTARDYDRLERGRYVLEIGGCHDCHTPGYTENAGKVDTKRHLVGDRLGWQGPWGTTYASNLRTVIGGMDEDQWVAYARRMEPRPPMPWFNVRAMSESDLRAIHLYVKALGPGGEAPPAYVPPGGAATGPVVRFPG